MSIVAIIQARMGSTRLPGKVQRDLCGVTMLGRVIQRTQAVPQIDRVVVAIPDLKADEILLPEITRYGADPFQGSQDDVLSRYCGAAERFNATTVVRITSDCPLLDPTVVGAMVAEFTRRRGSGKPLDYFSNTLERTFPRGLDAEVFTMAALLEAHAEATAPAEREHVTPFIYRHPKRFALAGYPNPEGNCSHLRWTVDTEEDFRFVRAVYEALVPTGECFGQAEVLALLQRQPELIQINAHIQQKEA